MNLQAGTRHLNCDLSLVLKRKLPALKRLFANDPRVLGVWLFGSQADGTAWSDIDLEAERG